MDIKWRIVFSQSKKQEEEDKKKSEGFLIDEKIIIEPIFTPDGNFKKNILEHAESIDTYESKYISKKNNIADLFASKLTFDTNVGDDDWKNDKSITYQNLIRKYLCKYSFMNAYTLNSLRVGNTSISKYKKYIEPYIQNITPKKKGNSYELLVEVKFREYSYIEKDGFNKNDKIHVYRHRDVNDMSKQSLFRFIKLGFSLNLIIITGLYQLKTKLIFHVEYNPI